MDHLSGHLDWNVTDTLSFSAKTYLNKIDSTRWVTFSALQTQQERVTKERHTGYLTSLTWRARSQLFASLCARGAVFDQEWQDNESERYSTNKRVAHRKNA